MTVSISAALAGTVGEYYQVEGIVTYIAGRNVYIQDETGAMVVYLAADAQTTKVGDKVKVYGALKNYNGLMEFDAVDETNAKFYEILSNNNSVDAQALTIAELVNDTANAYHAEKIQLNNVYISYIDFNNTYVTYTLIDNDGNTIKINRVAVSSQEECHVPGSLVTLEAYVSVYKNNSTEGNGYQLVTTNDKITVRSVCAHETTELINAVAATCTTDGYTGDTQCTVCKYYVSRGEAVDAYGHSHEAVVTAPDCENGGYTTYTCSCGDSYVADETAALGHEYQAVVTAPDCENGGYTTYTCSNCGDHYVADETAALGHNYESVVTPPQVGVQGFTTHTCSNCGDSYVDSYVDPLPEEVVLPSGTSELKLTGATLTLQSDLTLKIVVHGDLFTSGQYTDVRLEVVMTDAEGNVVKTAVYTAESEFAVYDKVHRQFSFTGISPKRMGDKIVMTLYGTYDGVEYSNSKDYGVSSYCYNKLNAENPNEKLCKVLANLLNFGAAHQIYTDYNTKNLVNAAMTDEHKAYVSTGELTLESKANKEYEVIENASASFYGANLTLNEKVEVQFVMILEDLTDVTLEITANGTTYSVDAATQFKPYSSKLPNSYKYNFTELMAKQMRSDITAKLCRNGQAISNTLLYSVESYAANKLANADTAENLVNLLKMMMYYGDAAAAYFGK